MGKATLLITLTVVLLICSNSFCQIKKPGITIGVSVLYAQPQKDFRDAYKNGLGAEVKGGIGFGKTYIIGTVGYTTFGAQPYNDSGKLTAIPVKIGLKRYFLLKRLFVNGDVGTVSLKMQSNGVAQSRFSADVGAGVRLLGMEAGIYYITWKNLYGGQNSNYNNTIEFKLGYNITL